MSGGGDAVGCAIDWPTTFADSASTAMRAISVFSEPSSADVVVSGDDALPARGTAWNVTVVATPLPSVNLTSLSTGGAYFSRVTSEDVLLIQQSGSFDSTFVYFFCSVAVPVRTWSLATQLLAQDDAPRAGSIALQVFNTDRGFVPVDDVVLSTAPGPTNQLSFLPVHRTLALDEPTSELTLRFAVTSNGSGSRDIFGIYPVRIQGVYDLTTGTSTPTTTTTTTTTTNNFVETTSSTSTPSTSTSILNSSSSSTSSTSTNSQFFGASDSIRSGDVDAALIGGIVGGAVFLICIAVLVAVCWHRKRSARPAADTKQGHLLPIAEARSESGHMYDQVPRLTEQQQLQTEYDAPTSPLN